MAIFLNLSDIIINKSSLEDVYVFKELIQFDSSGVYQEDDFLISATSLPLDLAELHLAEGDYVLHDRYGGPYREVTWFEKVGDIGYHTAEYPRIKDRLREIKHLTLDDIQYKFGNMMSLLHYVNVYKDY